MTIEELVAHHTDNCFHALVDIGTAHDGVSGGAETWDEEAKTIIGEFIAEAVKDAKEAGG